MSQHPREDVTLESLFQALSLFNSKLEKIQKTLDALAVQVDMPSIGLRLQKLCNTVAGPDNQVLPGDIILEGEAASDYFRGLGEATVLPLTDLPPWTHMARASGSWWLIQMT